MLLEYIHKAAIFLRAESSKSCDNVMLLLRKTHKLLSFHTFLMYSCWMLKIRPYVNVKQHISYPVS